MALIAVGFLVFVVLFTLAAVHAVRLAGRVLGDRINTMHLAAETIIGTEQIPLEWLERAPAEPSRRGRWKERQKRRAVRRIRKLRTYMQRTPCISDVESREYLMIELDRIRRQWLTSDPDTLITDPDMLVTQTSSSSVAHAQSSLPSLN